MAVEYPCAWKCPKCGHEWADRRDKMETNVYCPQCHKLSLSVRALYGYREVFLSDPEKGVLFDAQA